MEELFKSLSESVSEECFNEVLNMVEELLNEGAVDSYYQNKLNKTKTELANAKSYKRHLNKTTDFNANKEYRQAAGAKRQANDDWNHAVSTYGTDSWGAEEAGARYDEADTNKEAAKKKFSQKGTELYHRILNLAKQRNTIENQIEQHKQNGEQNTSKPATAELYKEVKGGNRLQPSGEFVNSLGNEVSNKKALKNKNNYAVDNHNGKHLRGERISRK